jgi:hypothetical protein
MADAEDAMRRLEGVEIHGAPIRLEIMPVSRMKLFYEAS